MSFGFNFNTLTNILAPVQVLGAGLSQIRTFNNAASASRNAGTFNAKIDAFNTERELQNTTRGFIQLLGRQRVEAASTGFTSTSQSFLAIQSETLSELERVVVESRQASKVRQDSLRFQAELQASQSEARAKSARRQTFTSTLTGISNVLSSFGG